MPAIAYPFGPLEANAYLLHNGVDAVVADPPADPREVLDEIKTQDLTLRAILLTHLHFDHAPGCAAMTKATGLPVFVGEEDWAMRNVLLSRGMLFGMPPVPEFEATLLQPGPVAWGTLKCNVIHAPGHSPGSLCYYFAAEKALLSGDVLFRHSLGRSDLPGGDANTLFTSLRQSIYTLPPDTVVYPGHGDTTTVGDEAAHNPFCHI